MYLRYDGAISRDFFHTLDALMRLQRARQRTNPDPKPLVAAAGSGAPLSRQSEQPAASECASKSNGAAELSDSGIRSVSQNSPKSSDHENQKELTRSESLDSGLLRPSKVAFVEVDWNVEVDWKLRSKTNLETPGKSGPAISRVLCPKLQLRSSTKAMDPSNILLGVPAAFTDSASQENTCRLLRSQPPLPRRWAPLLG